MDFKLIFSLCILNAFILFVSCRENELSKDDLEFRNKMTGLIKEMSRVYIKTTKKLRKATSSEEAVKILETHISSLSENIKNTVHLEINYPELFEKQKKKPPRESATLRNSIETFTLLITKLSKKYRSDPNFLKMYREVFQNSSKRDETIKKFFIDLVRQKRIDCENTNIDLKKVKTSEESVKILEDLLTRLKESHTRLRSVIDRYPDIVESEKNNLIAEEKKIEKLGEAIFDQMGKLNQNSGQETGELKENLEVLIYFKTMGALKDRETSKTKTIK